MGIVKQQGRWWTAAFMIASGCSFNASVGTIDASPPDVIDAPMEGVMTGPASCKAIKADMPSSTSGMYLIDPDGPGGDAPFMIPCDMTTDGGGWSIVFAPASSNFNLATLQYTAPSQRLRLDAADVMIAYRDANLAVVNERATFQMIQEWIDASPFTYPNTDRMILATVNGTPANNVMLRFGYNTWVGDFCDGGWDGSTRFGRVCIAGTMAPYFTAFSAPQGDTCSQSQAAWFQRNCGTDVRFTIAVR